MPASRWEDGPVGYNMFSPVSRYANPAPAGGESPDMAHSSRSTGHEHLIRSLGNRLVDIIRTLRHALY